MLWQCHLHELLICQSEFASRMDILLLQWQVPRTRGVQLGKVHVFSSLHKLVPFTPLVARHVRICQA
jgi:hypothetical protein